MRYWWLFKQRMINKTAKVLWMAVVSTALKNICQNLNLFQTGFCFTRKPNMAMENHPFLIGWHTSSNGCFSIVMLLIRGSENSPKRPAVELWGVLPLKFFSSPSKITCMDTTPWQILGMYRWLKLAEDNVTCQFFRRSISYLYIYMPIVGVHTSPTRIYFFV